MNNDQKQDLRKLPLHYIIRRYLLFQIPGLLILIIVLLFFIYVIEVPDWAVFMLIGAYILKELITVPFTWWLYVRPRLSATELMINRQGITMEKLDPRGFVKFQSEIWEAESSDPESAIGKGETVRILDIRGMRLVVERMNDTG